MRAFLAIELPEEVKNEVVRVALLLERRGFFKGKVVELENLHLTLKFFGEIRDQEAGMISDVLRGAAFPAFSCQLGKLGLFGDKILWIDLIDDGKVKKLHDMIDEKLGDFFETESRFHNHVTIARIKHLKDRQRLVEFMEKIAIQPHSFRVEEYVLKKSELLAEGPVYGDLFKFQLH